MQLLYGAQSHDNGTNGENVEFVKTREMQSGNVLALIRPVSNVQLGGDLVMIDTRTYVNNTQPVAASAGQPGPAQKRATTNEVRTIPGSVPGGRFRHGVPAVGRHQSHPRHLVAVPPDRGWRNGAVQRHAPRSALAQCSRHRSTACGCSTRATTRSSRS